MDKKNLEPGKRYRGYGFVNEFGEFQFVPEDTGSRAGREKCVLENDGLRVSETKKLLIIKMNIEKVSDKVELAKRIFVMFNRITKFINKYEI